MVEYACFKHKGNAENYCDEVFLAESPCFTVAIFCGKEEYINSLSCSFQLSEILKDTTEDDDLEPICKDLNEKIPEDIEYLILRIDSKLQVNTLRRGGVLAWIVNNGEMMTLPNGIYGLKEGDMLAFSAFGAGLVSGAMIMKW